MKEHEYNNKGQKCNRLLCNSCKKRDLWGLFKGQRSKMRKQDFRTRTL